MIDDGYNKYTRNPNYLGEILLYSSFAVLVNDAWVWFIMGYMWGIVFVMRMAIKDYSLSKKKGWQEYKETSWILLPKFFGKTTYALAVYAFLILAGWGICEVLH